MQGNIGIDFAPHEMGFRGLAQLLSEYTVEQQAVLSRQGEGECTTHLIVQLQPALVEPYVDHCACVVIYLPSPSSLPGQS